MIREKVFNIAVFGLFLLVVSAITLNAAGQDESGSLVGTVADELGGVLPGATVTARS